MKILYIGDIMGRAGRETVAEVLPGLVEERELDFVLAQSENTSHGWSILPAHMKELQKAGVDVFTGGNHSFRRPQILDAIANPAEPIIAPANMVSEHANDGWHIADTENGKVLAVSLLGSVFPEYEIINPLQKIDEILELHSDEDFAAIVVNLHADYSSEKVQIGHYLDGKVTMVVGDHWHVPTADARILPKGTAHMTDVGMCGSLNSSLGIELSSTIPRWRDGAKTKQDMADAKPWQFNALFFDQELNKVEHIRRIIE